MGGVDKELYLFGEVLLLHFVGEETPYEIGDSCQQDDVYQPGEGSVPVGLRYVYADGLLVQLLSAVLAHAFYAESVVARWDIGVPDTEFAGRGTPSLFESLQLVAVLNVLLILVGDGDERDKERVLVVFQLNRFPFVQHTVELYLLLFGLFA